MHFTSSKIYVPRSAGVFLQHTYIPSIRTDRGVGTLDDHQELFSLQDIIKSEPQPTPLKYNHWTIVYILKNTRINDLMQDALGDLILEP